MQAMSIALTLPAFPAGFPMWYLDILAGLIGAILGSFANVCIARMPRDESIVTPPSHCPFCGHRLAFWENIPLLSFVALRGRCLSCRRRIPWHYPVVELLLVVLSLCLWWHFRDPLHYFAYLCLFILPLVIASFIDLFHFLIPDSISISGIAIGILVHVFLGARDVSYPAAAIDSIVGIVVGGGTLFIVARAYEYVTGREGLGGGDVKLMAMLGAFFGWRAALSILLASSVVGSVIGIMVILFLRKGMRYAIPFGPFLSIAGIAYLFYGERFVGWYLGLF
jgi:leader peptidase (prepilin peptidase) / N-methyltransferase